MFRKIISIILFILFFSVPALAKYNAVMAPKFKWFDGSGDPASGYCVYSYDAGTTTASTTYSTATATANDWPVVLDSNGEADIYIDGSHKIVLRTDTIANGGTVEWTLDNYEGVAVESVVFSITATLAAITDGETDGELKLDAATGNMYSWDTGGDNWRIVPGNFYTTAALPASATYTIETGCTVFDTTATVWKHWDGDSWEVTSHSFLHGQVFN